MNKLTRLATTTVLISANVCTLCGQDVTVTTLDRIYREYSEQRAKPSVARLVLLDQQLRDLCPPDYNWQRPPWLTATYFKPYHKSIGLAPAMFDADILGYSGKLLAEAHALDPHSPYRSYTLYSTVFNIGDPWGVPSPVAAEAYLREFPKGPFVLQAYLALAHFYDDLYKVIKWEEADRRVGYKYHCYKAYVTSSPLPEQRRMAQELGVRYYERVVKLLPGDQTHAKDLAALRDGKNEGYSFFCGD